MEEVELLEDNFGRGIIVRRLNGVRSRGYLKAKVAFS